MGGEHKRRRVKKGEKGRKERVTMRDGEGNRKRK